MKCGFIDPSSDFASVLAAKAGPEVSIVPLDPGDEAGALAFDVLAVRIPPAGAPEYPELLAILSRCIMNPVGIPAIAFLPSADKNVIREVIGMGAYDYFVEKSSLDELRIVLRRAAQFHQLNRELAELRSAGPSQIFSVFNSANPRILEACGLAKKVADSDATLLVTGETGTGKELLARMIHESSRRSREPFLAVCCSALPETLIESELFGHEKGAFTGAVGRRQGRFEAAGCGTLFLDEIGELSPALQVKLLRVLQERTFERLGSSASRPLEARVVCATNRDLKAMVQEKLFRPDLYYRLNTVCIHLPPLRERPEDIVLLGLRFLRQYSEAHGRRVMRFRSAALKALRAYAWPGNVRELQHVVERSVLVCDGPEIGVEHLPSEFAEWAGDSSVESLENEVRNHKRRVVERALRENQYNKVRAARALGISRGYLHRLIIELNLPADLISDSTS